MFCKGIKEGNMAKGKKKHSKVKHSTHVNRDKKPEKETVKESAVSEAAKVKENDVSIAAEVKEKAVSETVKKPSVKKENKKPNTKKLRYFVMFVPNNNHRVRQFSISFDMLVFLTGLGAVVMLFVLLTLINTGVKLQEYEKQLNENEQIITLLTADNEKLTKYLREAKVTIDTTTGIQQQEAEKANAAGVPDIIPLNAGVKPTEYDATEGVVQFNTGYGTKVLSAADGVVSFVGENEKYGYEVKIDHGNGYETVYMINCMPQIGDGDKVMKGFTLYSVDEDGLILTYQVKFNGENLDPMSVIKIDG